MIVTTNLCKFNSTVLILLLMEVPYQNRESSAGIETGKANHLRSRSVALGKSRDITEPGQSNYLRSQSVKVGHNRDYSVRSIIDIPFPQGMEEIPSLKSRLDAEGCSADEWDGTSRRSRLVYSNCSPRKAVDVTFTSWGEGNELSPFSPASCYSRSPSTVEVASSSMQPSPSLISISSPMSTCSSNGAISVVVCAKNSFVGWMIYIFFMEHVNVFVF